MNINFKIKFKINRQVRDSTIVVDNMKYYSIELRGPVLPTAVHALFRVLRSSCSSQVSATFAHHDPTLAFSWAADAIAEGMYGRMLNQVKYVYFSPLRTIFSLVSNQNRG